MARLALIAIDGPSGVGKSTTAKALAARLGWDYLDTGGMYRCAALAALRSGLGPGDPGIRDLMDRLRIEQIGTSFLMDHEDVSAAIRTPEVTRLSSPLSADPRVREALVPQQRRIGERGGWVVDGRDIGTVVFPDACCKVFLTASIDARARRRFLELQAKGQPAEFPAVLADLAERDHRDSTRDVAPLRPAEDAMILDSSDLDLGQVVTAILARHQRHGG
ncbi:MAG: (d)CMP kinase [Acidobacteria bacterium]|nr:(d)CMP kinase [Acidobacteriota bacterium]